MLLSVIFNHSITRLRYHYNVCHIPGTVEYAYKKSASSGMRQIFGFGGWSIPSATSTPSSNFVPRHAWNIRVKVNSYIVQCPIFRIVGSALFFIHRQAYSTQHHLNCFWKQSATLQINAWRLLVGSASWQLLGYCDMLTWAEYKSDLVHNTWRLHVCRM